MAEPSATSDAPTHRSHLADRADAVSTLADRIGLREVGYVPQLSLRVPPDRVAGTVLDGLLPMTPTTWSERDGITALWFGPDEWLLVGEPLADAPVRDRLLTAVTGHGAVTDVSAQRIVLELRGAQVRGVLAHGCSLDLHPRVWKQGAMAQTLLARAPVGLALRSVEPDVVWLLVRASYASYVLDWLLDASSDLATREPAGGRG